MSDREANTEGLRRKPNVGYDLRQAGDLRLYEAERDDTDREAHIDFAREIYGLISENRSLELIASYAAIGIQELHLHVSSVVEFVNFFLGQDGHIIRLDNSLNVYDGEQVIYEFDNRTGINKWGEALPNREDSIPIFLENEKEVAVRVDRWCLGLAEAIYPFFASGNRTAEELGRTVIPALAADIITSRFDTSVVVGYLNRLLEEGGVPYRLNRYLEFV